jgi:hypothetical protein
MVIHPAETIDIFGKEVLRNNIPTVPRLLPMLRLQATTFYWWLIGKLELRPSGWAWSFGGLRLKRHKKKEDQLSALLRFALGTLEADGAKVSLSFSWSLDTLRRDMAQATKTGKDTIRSGSLAWLYLKRSTDGS